MSRANVIIPQSHREHNRTPQTVDELLNSSCPECGYSLYVHWQHVGGHYERQAFAACSNIDGGHSHFNARIDNELGHEYDDFRIAALEDYGDLGEAANG